MVHFLKALAAAALTVSTTFAGSFSDPVFPRMIVKRVHAWGDDSQVYGVQVDYVNQQHKDQTAFHGISNKGVETVLELQKNNVHIIGCTIIIKGSNVEYLGLFTGNPNFQLSVGSAIGKPYSAESAQKGQQLGGFSGAVSGDGDADSVLTILSPQWVEI